MTWASLVVGVCALITAAHAAIFAAWTRWCSVNVQLIRAGDVATFHARDQSPPWYVRYSRWLP